MPVVPRAASACPPRPLRSGCGLDRLQRRPDFVAVTKQGHVARTPGFVLQAYAHGRTCRSRVGFTVTKKVGNAVVRNRIKRRLRALAVDILAPCAEPGTDYVLVGRRAAFNMPYGTLRAHMDRALKRMA